MPVQASFFTLKPPRGGGAGIGGSGVGIWLWAQTKATGAKKNFDLSYRGGGFSWQKGKFKDPFLFGLCPKKSGGWGCFKEHILKIPISHHFSSFFSNPPPLSQVGGGYVAFQPRKSPGGQARAPSGVHPRETGRFPDLSAGFFFETPSDTPFWGVF